MLLYPLELRKVGVEIDPKWVNQRLIIYRPEHVPDGKSEALIRDRTKLNLKSVLSSLAHYGEEEEGAIA